VIHPALKSRLPPGHLLQAPLRTLRPAGLISVAGRLPALARAFKGVTGPHMAVGIGDQIDNAQVDPKKPCGLQGGLFGDINRGIRIKPSIAGSIVKNHSPCRPTFFGSCAILQGLRRSGERA
jgi:hypothetical protein